MLLALALATALGYVVAATGPAFAEPRRRRRNFPAARLLAGPTCAVCGRWRCTVQGFHDLA